MDRETIAKLEMHRLHQVCQARDEVIKNLLTLYDKQYYGVYPIRQLLAENCTVIQEAVDTVNYKPISPDIRAGREEE